MIFDDLSVYDLAGRFFLLGCIPEKRRRGSNQTKGSREMHRQHGFPLLIGHFVDHRIPRKSRVVHQDVQPTPGFDRLVYYALGEVGLGNIPREDYAFSSSSFNLLGSFLGRLRIKVADNHPSSLPGKEERHRSPDPTAGAGYDCHSTLEHLFHPYFPFLTKPKKCIHRRERRDG
jgi:hypothetical protein